MILYGKELDDELAKRKLSGEERRAKGLTYRADALAKGVDPSEIIAYERGQDVCPHEKWIDQVGGFPIAKFILKVCAKCGKNDDATMEKVSDSNMSRVYEVCKRSMEKLSEGLSVKSEE